MPSTCGRAGGQKKIRLAWNPMGSLLLALGLVVCMAACDLAEWNDINEKTPSEVVYADDWKYITLYLDGVSAPAESQTSASARKMTPDTARVGFNFFEAVFVSGGTVARISWELGKPASIDKVRRNVTYSHNGDHIAILFAGRMADKTLLAVGKLYSVDDKRGTTINSDSSFVTFELHALTGGASHEPHESSFHIAETSSVPPAVESTVIMNAHIGTRDFPLYRLPGGEHNIQASYGIALDGAEWAEFADKIIVSAAGETEKREARYSVGNGRYYYALYEEDLTTLVTMTNNQTIGRPAQSPITFSFNTSATNHLYPLSSLNGIFTLIFEIPVYAYTNAPGVGGNSAINWTIRPAYTTYLYNIDSGVEYNDTMIVGNWGGAILMGVNADADDLDISVRWG